MNTIRNSTTNISDRRPARSGIRRMLAGTAMSGLALTAVTTIGITTAGAESSTAPKLEAARAACLTGIDNRVTRLTQLTAKVSGDKFLTDGHRSTLSGIVSHALDGMNTLRPQAQAATDAASLRTPCTSVVNDYRVYALVSPQVHLTRAADAAAHGISRLSDVDTKIDEAIAAAAAAGKDVTKVTADADAFTTAVAKVSTDISGMADSVSALTPADYNADHGVLDAARAHAQDARTDVKAARTVGQTVRADLKALHG